MRDAQPLELNTVVVCSIARHFTIAVPFSTQVHKLAPASFPVGILLLEEG